MDNHTNTPNMHKERYEDSQSSSQSQQPKTICWEVISLIETVEECQDWLQRVQSRLQTLEELLNHTQAVLRNPHINTFQLSDIKARAELRYKKYQSEIANAKLYETALQNQIHLLEGKEASCTK